MPPPAPGGASTARTVAVNSAWMTLEVVAGAAAGLAASVAVARVLGPRQLGIYSYLLWAVAAAANAGALGMPAAVRKYAAEHLGAGRVATALAVVARMWRLQSAVAAATCAAALLAAYFWIAPEHRLSALLAALGIGPAILMGIPTAASAAAQRAWAVVVPSLAAAAVNLAGIALSLYFRWDLPGLAGSLLAARLVDLCLRHRFFRAVSIQLRRMAPGGPDRGIDKELARRMRRFCASAAVLQVLNLVVWDRSEVFFLARYCDIREVAFYSIPFNLTAQALLFARAFSSSAGAALMQSVGGSKDAARAQAPVLFRGLAIFMFPMLLGAAALSGPLIHVVYGDAYRPAVAVLALLSAFAVARVALAPLLFAFAAFEIQSRAVAVTAGCAAVNVALDFLLIPAHGALGAALANGISQTAAVVLLFAFLAREARVDIAWGPVFRIAAAATAAAAPAAAMAFAFSPVFALAAGILTGAVLYGPLLRRTGALDRDDRKRLEPLVPLFPRPLRRPAARLLFWLTRQA
jgi:O-antigen/teichoic acid export membrane protein